MHINKYFCIIVLFVFGIYAVPISNRLAMRQEGAACWIESIRSRENLYFCSPNITAERLDMIDSEVEFAYQDSCKSWNLEARRAFGSDLVQLYKVHLMPKPENLERVARVLVEKIETDPVFAAQISVLKITRACFETDPILFKEKARDDLLDKHGNVLPLIVLYPAQDQDAAQAVLEYVANLFPNEPGLDVTDIPQDLRVTTTVDGHIVPRFNIPAQNKNHTITSPFIYYAQSGADLKYKALSLFDERENYALYKSDFLGAYRDFHLYLPEKS